MGCGMGVIKYLLFIFNFIFALCGLAILIVGVIIHLEITNYSDAVEQNVMFPSITLIVVGIIIFIIAFFGCCGAIRESHCMIVTFASLLLTILILQVAVAIYAFVVLKNSDDLQKGIRQAYADELFAHYKDTEENKNAVNKIQEYFECCGIRDYSDFESILHIPAPGSCCKKPVEQICSASDIPLKQKGCAVAIQDALTYIGAALGGVALGIAAIELIGIIFALCLANSIKNEHRRGYRV